MALGLLDKLADNLAARDWAPAGWGGTTGATTGVVVSVVSISIGWEASVSDMDLEA